MYELKDVTIANLVAAIEEELDASLDAAILDESLVEDLNWSIYRLENCQLGSKLICVDSLYKESDAYSIQGGYWEVNGKAHYLCTPRAAVPTVSKEEVLKLSGNMRVINIKKE
jgi:hypothetical protein